jgi:ATP-dependent helicase/DNAse subunit B
MDKLTEITENKINEGANLITNGEFTIAPKKIGKVNYGCTLCQFKDICFHTNDDVVELEPLNIDDILERPKKNEERGDE